MCHHIWKAVRQNLVSAHVPSHFKRSLLTNLGTQKKWKTHKVAPHASWHSDESFPSNTKRALISPGRSGKDTKLLKRNWRCVNNFVKRHRTHVKFLNASWSGAEHQAEVFFPSDGPRRAIFLPQSKTPWFLFISVNSYLSLAPDTAPRVWTVERVHSVNTLRTVRGI